MNLQTYLQKNELNISQFVEKANLLLENKKLNQPTVWRIIKGKVTPRPETAALIEQATGCQVSKIELLFPNMKEGGPGSEYPVVGETSGSEPI